MSFSGREIAGIGSMVQLKVPAFRNLIPTPDWRVRDIVDDHWTSTVVEHSVDVVVRKIECVMQKMQSFRKNRIRIHRTVSVLKYIIERAWAFG